MISEVANALFITYFASEYIISSDDKILSHNRSHKRNIDYHTTQPLSSPSSSSSSSSWNSFIATTTSLQNIITLLLLITINIIDRVTGAIDIVNNILEKFLHLPKILFAATSYLLALYIDVRHHHPRSKTTTANTTSGSVHIQPISFSNILVRIGWAFLRVLPAYPILAVGVSFIFMPVIRLWEVLDLPEEWLNAPIYYGVLYGPFSWVYLQVKRHVLEEAVYLPV